MEKKGFFSTLLENELIESRESPDLPIFNLRAVSAATNNFSPVNKLGKGGFGTVYKVKSTKHLKVLVTNKFGA